MLSKKRFNNRQKPTFNENWRGCRKSGSTIAKNQVLTKTGEVVEKAVQQSPMNNAHELEYFNDQLTKDELIHAISTTTNTKSFDTDVLNSSMTK